MNINGREGDNPQKTYRILSLDGGGIRGLITAVWLCRLEEELETPIRNHFNLIAGTSTGSILACGISLGIPASQLINIYKNRGKEIFTKLEFLPRILTFIKKLPTHLLDQQIYCDQGLKKVLQDEFNRQQLPLECISNILTLNNENTKGDSLFEDIRHLNGDDLTTLVTSYNTLSRKAVIFDSREHKYDKIPVWEICKASSSAPFYFPAHIMKIDDDHGKGCETPLIDGGVIASNPTACAIAEGMKATNLECKKGEFVVVSLGTGNASRSISIEQARNWGYYHWGYNIINVLFDGVSQAMDHIAMSMLTPETYFRFQTDLEKDSLDDVSAENVESLQKIAIDYFKTAECQGKIKKLKSLLKDTCKVKVNQQEEIVNNSSCENSSRNGHNHEVESTLLLPS